MRLILFVLTAMTATAGSLYAPAEARLQEDILCYAPDFEWPLPCDDE